MTTEPTLIPVHSSRTRYVVKTLGCKANLYDSQLIEAEFQRQGIKPLEDGQDVAGGAHVVCVVNSCTVTDEADRQSRKMASRLARDFPESLVVVTGCAAEVDPERIAASKGISYVVGNRNKPEMVSLILDRLAHRASDHAAVNGERPQGEVLGAALGYTEMLSRHPMDREWPLVTDETFDGQLPEHAFSAKTRAFLKIQEGCNSFCTYCIIPYGRGPSRSLTIDEVVTRVHRLVDAGVREIVLAGTNLGDYGTDLGTSVVFDDLCEAILAQTGLERLRLSSLDPVEITPRLIEMMRGEPRLVPHFHVSLQSASAKILRLMKRKYRDSEVVRTLEAIATLSGPHGPAFVGMDVITGFPGETDADFDEGCALLERLPWSRLHVFPYSERAGTPATRLPGSVPMAVRKQRAQQLQRLSLARLTAQTRLIADQLMEKNRPLEGILVERAAGQKALGYTADYRRVELSISNAENAESDFATQNAIVQARVTGYRVDEASGDALLTAAPIRGSGN